MRTPHIIAIIIIFMYFLIPIPTTAQACESDEDCDNLLWCDGEEICVDPGPTGTCISGTPPDCDDSISCTADSCNETTDECDHVPNDALCPDDTIDCTDAVCIVGHGCDQTENNANCLCGAWCVSAIECDETETGSMEYLNTVIEAASVDGAIWTIEYPEGTELIPPTDDRRFIDALNVEVVGKGELNVITDSIDTEEEFFTATKVAGFVGDPEVDDVIIQYSPTGCVDTGVEPCPDDGLYCNGMEWCIEQSDECVTIEVSCNDGVYCTIDTCNETTDTCDHTPDDDLCDDDLWCTGTEYCDPDWGCRHTNVPDCDDGFDCTFDYCNEEDDECSVIEYDSMCTDYLWCNGEETCQEGLGCVAGVDPCDDLNVCSDDSCTEVPDPVEGTPYTCVNECNVENAMRWACCFSQVCFQVEGTICRWACNHDRDCIRPGADGLWCNGEAYCSLGAVSICIFPPPPNCDDGNPCTSDLCWEAQDQCINPCNAATGSDPCCSDPACSGE